MASINLPKATSTPVESQVELLASTVLPYVQGSGVLLEGEWVVEIGDPIAWDATLEKFIKYVHGGSGGHEIAVGFVRIPNDSTDEDVAIEVVFAGGVKYSVVSAADNYDASVLTDLGARYIVSMDMIWF